ncbi:GNAT family N-acetyltransferase [Streptosporangium sp. NBC_01639]|uniref:GNAT family N-acetyltransferase n=1 Tax=Streptosporangium sp. NBC_01639 TaxID=2975948 RepID=UPI0038681386|nr:GNAT family N-acetyltransferase [Streptosporangium sp. NBC_01639]
MLDAPVNTNEDDGALPEVAEAWVQGWTLSRATAPPVAVPGGYRVDVGLPGHLIRYVLPRFDPAVLRCLMGEPAAPGTWLKVCARPETVAAVLPTGWTVKDPEYMMTASLRFTEFPTPSGYRLQVTTQGAITDAEVLDTDEQVAARGRIARTGSFAVIDQVETSPSHRRRGLGRLVMGALGHRAATQGARTGVLVATRDGRGLYQSLDWTLHAPVTAAVFRPEEVAPPAR